MNALGIDIGGGSVKAVRLVAGEVVATSQSQFYDRPSADELFTVLKSIAVDTTNKCDAVGLCVPGVLDLNRSRVVLSVNVPGLVDRALADFAAAAAGTDAPPPIIFNDAFATCFDIAHSLRLQGRIACLVLGTGIGLSVMDDGRPVLIDGDSSGHIGQVDMSFTDDAPIGSDGGRGSLEAYLGAAALTRQYDSVQEFLQAASVDHFSIRALVRSIRLIHAIYRPNHIVLAGGIGIRITRLLPAIRNRVSDCLTSLARPGWQLQVGVSDFHAACGAARLAEMAVRSEARR